MAEAVAAGGGVGRVVDGGRVGVIRGLRGGVAVGGGAIGEHASTQRVLDLGELARVVSVVRRLLVDLASAVADDGVGRGAPRGDRVPRHVVDLEKAPKLVGNLPVAPLVAPGPTVGISGRAVAAGWARARAAGAASAVAASTIMARGSRR